MLTFLLAAAAIQAPIVDIRVCVYRPAWKEVRAIPAQTRAMRDAETYVTIAGKRQLYVESGFGEARAKDWFVKKGSFKFAGKTYVNDGLSRSLVPAEFRFLGDHEGTAVVMVPRWPDTIFVLERGIDCSFRPYKLAN